MTADAVVAADAYVADYVSLYRYHYRRHHEVFLHLLYSQSRFSQPTAAAAVVVVKRGRGGSAAASVAGSYG